MNLVEAGVVQFVFPLYSCQVKWKEEEEKTKKKDREREKMKDRGDMLKKEENKLDFVEVEQLVGACNLLQVECDWTWY